MPGSNATGAFVLLRVYAYDKQSPNKTDIWGAVKPPVVRYKVSFFQGVGRWVGCVGAAVGGMLNQSFLHTSIQLYDKTKSGGGVWYTLDRCSEENTRVASQFVSTVATGAARALASEEQTGQVRRGGVGGSEEKKGGDAWLWSDEKKRLLTYTHNFNPTSEPVPDVERS